ncbi:MAG: sulfite exporter TauE/SafE family protein [Planctomycetota bacterium]
MTAAGVVAIVSASLLGSLHCAGMCGAFVSLACGVERAGRGRLQAAYHGGRLIGYSLLGALAGTLGSVIDLGGAAVGMGRVAAIVGATTMLVIAGVVLSEWAGVRVFGGRAKPPAVLTRLFRVGAGLAQRGTPTVRAGAIGGLTVLLPCGWLYAFAVVAAATASPVVGALVMASFWVGTVPALAALGWSVGAIRSRLGAGVKPIAGVVLLGAGAVTLIGAARLEDSAVKVMLANVSAAGPEDVAGGDAVLGALPGAGDGDCPLCDADGRPAGAGE